MRTAGRLLSSLLLSAVAGGCGLGTEIGNGKKPRDDKSPTPGAKDPGDENVDESDMGDDEVLADAGTPDSSDNVGSETGATSDLMPETIRSGGDNLGFDFDLAALAAKCASPFAAIDAGIAGKLLLRRTDPDVTDPAAELRARFEDGSWVLSIDKDLYEITPDQANGDYGVTAERVDAGPVNVYTCGELVTQTANISGRSESFQMVSVELNGPGGPHKVAWYTLPGESGEVLARITVELKSEAGGGVKLIALDVVQ